MTDKIFYMEQKPLTGKKPMFRTFFFVDSGQFGITERYYLVESSGDPVFATCRALVDLGLTGEWRSRWAGEEMDLMIIRDIEQAAKFSTVESDKGGIRFANWSPHPMAEIDKHPSTD